MGMELNQDAQRRLLAAYLAETGGRLQDAPDGPRLDEFRALELAQAVEAEINRAAVSGFTKIRLDFHLNDAATFAAFLRRASSAGV